MSNPYTKPSISGYNTNPPPDDGSQTADNEVTWAKHKDKIGDPLKNYVDAINQEARDAFGLTFLSGISAQSTAYTVQTSDRGKLISVTNTTTITLLPAATAGSGFPLAIRNAGSGTVTVDGDGSDTINGVLVVAVHPGDTLVITCDGTAWEGYYGERLDDERFALGGDFDAGQNIFAIRQGARVTLMSEGVLTHSSDSTPLSSNGVLDAEFRPSTALNFVYDVSNSGFAGFRVIRVTSNGTISMAYRDFSGALVADTDIGSEFNITYVVRDDVD